MEQLHQFLIEKADLYNQKKFITDDPIIIPHLFTKKQDIEIAGLFAAILAWGNRKSIINSCNKLLQCMDNAPYDFVIHSQQQIHKKAFNTFVHRTFNEMDAWHIINFLHHHYATCKNDSVENAFTIGLLPTDDTIEKGLTAFHHYVFSFNKYATLEQHCIKHIASPQKKSACKRLNMYLRWMVRNDTQGVDFGIWKNIQPSQLIIPIDVHVNRVAKKLGILQRTQNDWQAAVELTQYLKQIDPLDPVKFDYALFGLGVVEKF
jgi:uncharacterized protein (TIGR02757 family)